VANLFFNTPARLKFLKAPGTEKRVIDELITRYALAYPQIRFRLVHDGRITFQSTGSGDQRDVLTAIYGPETARQLLDIAGGEHGTGQSPEDMIQVNGYVSPPNLHRSNRKHISLYVNSRWIKDNSLSYAVIQAYHTLLPTGRFPLAAVFVSISPEAVDVNVHPAKTEVRFRQANRVFAAVQRSVRRTLLEESPIPAAGHFSTLQSPSWSGSIEQLSFSRRSNAQSRDHGETGWQQPPDEDGSPPASEDELVQGRLEKDSLPIMRVIGQVGAAYIITEGPDGLFLIDQHAAHERILYESFMAAWEKDGGKSIATQRLINSETVHFTPDQTALLEENLPLLEQIGFEVESFGPNTFVVRGVPGILTKLNPTAALTEVVDELEHGDFPMQGAIEAKIVLRVCKSAAIKAGQTLSTLEMEELIHQLESCQNPHTCPHGRPTLIHLSAAQLAREFGRT
jgi:DNA mismatch repair protein MutL